MIELVRNNQPLHTLDVELAVQPLTSARRLGLSNAWIQKLELHNPEARRALGITRLTGGSASSKLLQQGDLLLAIDGATVNQFPRCGTCRGSKA